MLVLSSATASGVRYWQASALHSMWLGNGAALLGLQTGPSGPGVDPRELRELLAGRRPGGEALTSRPAQRRRQGWDLVFAAPKSVSLLAAADPEEGANILRSAFREAVAATLWVLEQRSAWVYHDGGRERAAGVVAGAFEHMSGGAAQPHLHAHVVLANLAAREDAQWGCLVGSELWRWREGLGACFQLALRARLASGGLPLAWEVGPGGLGEVVGVSSAERSAASSRSLATRAGAIWFGSGSSRASRVSQGHSRAQQARRLSPATHTSKTGTPARQLVAPRTGTGLPPPPPSPGAVASALAQRGSSFAEPDVLVALAETCPAGLDAKQAARWALEWCEAATPGPQREGVTSTTVTGRWTTSLAGHFDRQLSSAELEGRFAHLAEVTPELARRELEVLGFGGTTAQAALELACSGRAVEVLPRAPWLAQAACLDAARAAWQASGMTVAVTSPSEESQRRWRALTSLRTPDSGAEGRPGRRVLVVDAADRIGPAALARLVANAAASATKVVLVPGGTVPARAAALAASLDELLERSNMPSLLPAQPSTTPALGEVFVPGLVVRGAFTGWDAFAHTVSAWRQHYLSGEPALMVALGPPEAEALNLAARSELGIAGAPGEAAFQGRLYAPGEVVMALRRIGGAPGRVPAGTRGTVLSATSALLSVQWHLPEGPCTAGLGHDHARDLGYGYATTVPYLRNGGGDHALLVLGDPVALTERALAPTKAWVALAGPGMPAPSPGAPAGARWQAGVSELATSWPDEQLLRSTGPRPLERAWRERWERAVGAKALERAHQLAVGGWQVRGQAAGGREAGGREAGGREAGGREAGGLEPVGDLAPARARRAGPGTSLRPADRAHGAPPAPRL